jgi:hypothetical protein
MADADSVIAAIFAAASEDEHCSPAAEGLHKLYSEGAWEAPKIVEAIRTAGDYEADQT